MAYVFVGHSLQVASLSESGSWSQIRPSQVVVCGCRQVKAWLGFKDGSHTWLANCYWLLAGGLSSTYVGQFSVLLEYLHDMAAGFPQSE